VAVSPWITLPSVLVVVPLLWVSTRWYLRRAPAGYLREMAAWSRLTGGVAETAEGGRTMEALRLQERRIRRTDDDIREQYRAERYTLFLRTVWFPAIESAYLVPVATAVVAGGLLHARGLATVGQVTTVALYMRQLVDPLDVILSWLDHLQIGAAAFARLVDALRAEVTIAARYPETVAGQPRTAATAVNSLWPVMSMPKTHASSAHAPSQSLSSSLRTSSAALAAMKAWFGLSKRT
jgi:ABC-type multidrug transport system fused ATPase/permease subunit